MQKGNKESENRVTKSQQYAAGSGSDSNPSHLSWPLAVAADNLHFIRVNLRIVVELEVDILDEERPHFVAETVCVEMALSGQHFVFAAPLPLALLVVRASL